MEFRVHARPVPGLGIVFASLAACLTLVSAAMSAPHAAAEGRCCTASDRAGGRGAPSLAHALYLPLIVDGELRTNVWQAEYYANENLVGVPAYTLEETRIDYDWGTGGPAGLPTDHFSARWTGQWEFEAGEYTFFAFADDGILLWFDDMLLIDSWKAGRGSHEATTTVERPGLHRLTLEYYEGIGNAAISLRWRRTDLFPQWRGDYYTEPWVEGGWVYAQDDSVIQFDWKYDSPPGLPVDGFSIAWNATPLLMAGTHRIYLYSDDGYQFFVDGTKKLEDGWYTGPESSKTDVWYDLYANGEEQHKITYHFKDWGGLAEARLWIEYLAYGDWDVEYYGNPNLTEPAQKTSTDVAVFHDWGTGAPKHTGLDGDRFSVRWSGQRYYQAGCYRFGLFVDDGVRLWVDGELLVDEWHDARALYYSPVTYLTTGLHDVVIEYYEHTGEAEIRFWWE